MAFLMALYAMASAYIHFVVVTSYNSNSSRSSFRSKIYGRTMYRLFESGAEAQQREEWEPETQADECPTYNSGRCRRPDLLAHVVAFTFFGVHYCEVGAGGDGTEDDGPLEDVQEARPGHSEMHNRTTGEWHSR